MVALVAVLSLVETGTAETEPAAELQISVAAGRVTLSVRDAPLRTVLALIARRAGIDLAAEGDLDARITTAFAGVAIEDALARLVSGYASIRSVAPSSRSAAGSATRSEPDAVPSEPVADGSSAESSELVAALSLPAGDRRAVESLARLVTESSDPLVRARAAMALGGVRRGETERALTRALIDTAAAVRVQAIYALRQNRGVEAVAALAQILRSDADPRVRRAAVRALSVLPGTEAAVALASAAEDAHDSVRQEAARLIRPAASP